MRGTLVHWRIQEEVNITTYLIQYDHHLLVLHWQFRLQVVGPTVNACLNAVGYLINIGIIILCIDMSQNNTNRLATCRLT